MFKKKDPGQERRKFTRMDTVLPIQFFLLSQDKKEVLSGKEQAYSNNIGKGGICLSVRNLKPEFVEMVMAKQVKLRLEIELPVLSKPVLAEAAIAWASRDTQNPEKYLIGLRYEEINARQNNKIMRYVWAKKLLAPVMLLIITILVLNFAINSYQSMKLIQGNKLLVEQLVSITQKSNMARQQVKTIARQSQDLKSQLQALQVRLTTIEDERNKINQKMPLAAHDSSIRQKEIDKQIEGLIKEKAVLQGKLVSLQNTENAVTSELLRIDEKKVSLEKTNLDKMYEWLKVHQNPRTGLAMSFEGDSDIAGWSFIYDQSLLIQTFTLFSDFARAKKALDFFASKARVSGGLYYNAYYFNDGTSAEYTIHCGPNIWLAIAALQYTNKSKDNQFIPMAENIAKAVIEIQNEDKDGGIRGGPDVGWYSTEHNLDAYALFNMLYKITAKPKYDAASKKTLKWIIQHTYDRQELPIKRGKGDSTVATDTYAWSIAALTPETLNTIGMNPDRILEFAENNCAVEVNFLRPEGKIVRVKGFDFAPARHVSRGGVCSPEWTAQMIVAFKLMADYYSKQGFHEKAQSYQIKAEEYLGQLSNMIISSPSPSGQGESCLPYATQDAVDTGHGWMTPKGKSTCSIAGTAYTLFAYYGYNPLGLDK